MDIHRRNRSTALALVAIVVGMLAATYAMAPLYELFCRVTGYGGTPNIAEQLPSHLGNRIITIRFNADTDTALPWKFYPEQKEVKVRTGENGLAFYYAENLANEPVRGMATYNVTPEKAGVYFSKIDCFCFNEQQLAAGQKVDMPVSFFVDPAIETDPDMQDVHTITLSYTFFKAIGKPTNQLQKQTK